MDEVIEPTLDLARRLGVIRPHDLESRGIPRQALYRLENLGDLVRVGRGLYALPGAEVTTHRSLVEISKAVPQGVISLLSALRFHELTTQGPSEVWLAIENKAWRPKSTPWPVQLVYMSGEAFRAGVGSHAIEGVDVRVFSPAKTVADCFKYRNRIGLDVAVEALRDYLRTYPDGAEDIWRFGRICRVTRVLQPYLEALL